MSRLSPAPPMPRMKPPACATWWPRSLPSWSITSSPRPRRRWAIKESINTLHVRTAEAIHPSLSPAVNNKGQGAGLDRAFQNRIAGGILHASNRRRRHSVRLCVRRLFDLGWLADLGDRGRAARTSHHPGGGAGGDADRRLHVQFEKDRRLTWPGDIGTQMEAQRLSRSALPVVPTHQNDEIQGHDRPGSA